MTSVHSTLSGTISSGHNTICDDRPGSAPIAEGRGEGRGIVGTARTDGGSEGEGDAAIRRAEATGSGPGCFFPPGWQNQTYAAANSSTTMIVGSAMDVQSSACSSLTTSSESSSGESWLPEKAAPCEERVLVMLCCSKLLRLDATGLDPKSTFSVGRSLEDSLSVQASGGELAAMSVRRGPTSSGFEHESVVATCPHIVRSKNALEPAAFTSRLLNRHWRGGVAFDW
mmetsp:Transcript_11598/g.22035  ORF Transcript_11598/g.22035 Transcript_11598/m.22035 type:complete len:227 (-) Transcript_11598:49-729(-)